MKQINKVEQLLKEKGVKYTPISIPADLPIDVETHMKFHRRPVSESLPTMIYRTEKGLIAAQRRGDMRISLDKLKKLAGVKKLTIATKEDLTALGVKPGVVPVVGLNLPTYIDKGVFVHKQIYSGTFEYTLALKMDPKDVAKLNQATEGNFAEVNISGGKKRVFSGTRATGRLHLGNYLGAVKGYIELQNNPDYECIYMAVDVHTITTPFDAQTLSESTRNIIMDYLSCGLNPEKSIITAQSLVQEHTELAFIFSSAISVARMQHLPTFKEKVKQHPDNVTMALLNYPVLMAADILLYKAHLVPAGLDQEPHLEVTREIARKMNDTFSTDFPETKRFSVKGEYIPSLSGEGKMSKSVEGSYINLTDDLETIKKKLAGTPTDSGKGGEIPTNGGVASLLKFVDLFQGENKRDEYEKKYLSDGIRYKELKESLAEAIYNELEPIREKRKELESKPGYVDEVIESGAVRARKIAQKTMSEVKEKMGLKGGL